MTVVSKAVPISDIARGLGTRLETSTNMPFTTGFLRCPDRVDPYDDKYLSVTPLNSLRARLEILTRVIYKITAGPVLPPSFFGGA
jgi:hypothetical protein